MLLCCAAWAQTARVVLRWKATEGVKGYQVQVARDTAFSGVVLDQKVAEPVLKWEALPSTTFYWRVRSFDPEGRASEWSAARQIAPATGPPAPLSPLDAAVVPCSDGNHELSLESSGVLREYVLEVSTDARFGAAETTTLLGAKPVFSLPLAPGTYSWRGRGVDLTGRSTEASPARKLTVRLAAPRPATLPDVAPGTASVSLEWSASPCAKRYVVEAWYESPERALLEATEPRMSFRPKGIGEYRFRVAAKDEKGEQSEWSAEGSFQVRLPAPVARAEIVHSAQSAAGREVELSWAPSASAVGYLVEVARADSFKGAQLATVTGVVHRLTLQPGRYQWRVTARDGAGHLSLPSDARKLAVSDSTPPPAVALAAPVSGAVLARPADGALAVSWSDAGAGARYELEVDGVGKPVEGTSGTLTLAEGPHALRVRALANGLSSAWSPEVRFFFGTPAVVNAKISFGTQPLRCNGVSTSRVEVRLYDAAGRVVRQASPQLAVDRGELEGLHPEGDAWVAQWRSPDSVPLDPVGTLTVREREYQAELKLQLVGDYAPLSVGAALGGRFNGGAVSSPSGVFSVGWRAAKGGGRFGGHFRASLYSATATIAGPDGPVAARVVAPTLSLLVGAQLDFRPWSVRGLVGPGIQLASTSVGAAQQTSVLPSVELVGAVGRRLGPGTVELELSFLYGRLDNPIARLHAGGLFIGVGYRFELGGGI